jgi:hypothetical protein
MQVSYGATLYPNPNRGAFTIALNKTYADKDVSISIIDMLGREVYNQNHMLKGSDKIEMNMDLASGRYNVILSDKQGRTLNRIFFAVTD